MEYLSPKDGGLPVSPARLRAEIILITVFLVATLGLVAFCSHALAAPVPVVRVMVDRERQVMRINGFDLLVSGAEDGRSIAHEDRKASIALRCSLGGKIEVDTGGRKRKVSGPLRVSSLGGFMRVGASQYRDDLYVYSFNGDCIAVNHVDLEKYVAGLLNSEMSAKWSLESLKAQAIAARTYAIYQMKEASSTRARGLKPPFDLDSSVKDQVYEGAHMERYKTIQAVALTRGQVLTYKGEPIKAFYHSTCGGRTETPDRVWGVKVPYLRSIRCDYCGHSPRFNWVYSISKDELERKLSKANLLKGSLVSLAVVERNGLGRAGRVEVKGTGGSTVVAATKLRDLVGTLNLRSTDFNVTRNASSGAGELVFVGHGSGHGVGMCQWGAKTMGEQGQNYRRILYTYYPVADITKMY